MLAAVGFVVLGLVQMLFGYRLFRILVCVAGALIGFFYAPVIIVAVTGEDPGTAVAIAIGVGLAAAFALVAWYVFWLAVFAWGASIGFAVAVAAFGTQPLLAVVIGIAVGGLAMLFQRALIVLLTALTGAWLVVSGIAYLLGAVSAPPRGLIFDPWLDIHAPAGLWLFIIIVVLAAVGALYQVRDTAPMFGRKV